MMTNIEYLSQLIDELKRTKQETLFTYEHLKSEKGYLDKEDRYYYLKLVDNCHSIADRSELLMNFILEGKINPYDEVEKTSILLKAC